MLIQKLGHSFFHTVIDDQLPVAYAENNDDENTAATVLECAVEQFTQRGRYRRRKAKTGGIMTENWHRISMPRVEVRRSMQKNRCYRLHSHDAFSIGAIDAGSSILTVSPDGIIKLKTGDVVIIPSGHVHACNPEEGCWRYRMMHLDQTWAAELSSGQEDSDLFTGVSVFRCADLYSRFSDFNDAIFADKPRNVIEARFVDLLTACVSVAPNHRIVGATNPGLLARLAPVMKRLRWDDSNPSLSELAASVDMSKYQLVRAMRNATGLSPLAWRQNVRMIQARSMLRDGRPIAETAHALGFTDQSHFHRIFRAHVASSPGNYRR